MNQDHTKRKEQENKLRNAVIAGSANEIVQRYGSAGKEHIVSYLGNDNERGKVLTKSLKGISKSKTNIEFYGANIKQQAGFSAEVKVTARRNAEQIINRSPNRTIRTDDLGNVNDQIYDLVDILPDGSTVQGSGSQLKFVGSNPKDTLNKLSSKSYNKYFKEGVSIEVASDDFDALIGTAGKKGLIDDSIEKLKHQEQVLRKKGEIELADSKLKRIKKYEKIKDSLKKSPLTRKEAIEARLHPFLSTAKDVVGVSHKAGLEQAKMGGSLSGAMALVKNLIEVWNKDKTPIQAAEDIAKDSFSGATVGYLTGFLGSITKATLQNSTNATLQSISRTNFPTRLATTSINVWKTIGKFIKKEIDITECIEQLGKDGFAEISSAMMATLGGSLASESLLLGVVGSITGATIGYAASVRIYQELVTSLREEKLSKEKRIRIEKECQEAVDFIEQYRVNMNNTVKLYLLDSIETFSAGFNLMDQAICDNDINGYILGNVRIQKLLGYETQFESQEEFDELMISDVEFKL